MKTSCVRALGTVLLLAVGGCASSGTNPHDMSVKEHEAASRSEQVQADAHEAQYDPTQQGDSEVCPAEVVCWTTWGNPTAEHKQAADHHRRLAQRHRKAADALRQAESDACSGFDERDRDLSPFFHRQDIESVSVPTPASQQPVEVVFRAVQGLSRDRLQQLVDCHIARSAAMGHDMPEMDYCPLVPKGVEATVSEGEGSFIVTISVGASSDSRDEVLKRAERLRQAASN